MKTKNSLDEFNDKWYERHGARKPDHQPHLTEDQIEERMEKMRQQTRHGNWKQQGRLITCRKCPLPHSTSIPTSHMLSGTDNAGMPILVKIS